MVALVNYLNCVTVNITFYIYKTMSMQYISTANKQGHIEIFNDKTHLQTQQGRFEWIFLSRKIQSSSFC
jgi:hypothetical protein